MKSPVEYRKSVKQTVRGIKNKEPMKNLNFSPKNHCFSKALIKWKGIALNGFSASGKITLDLSGENITELLLDLFSPLSFVEVCLLHRASGQHPDFFKSIDWNLFFQKQNLHLNSRTLELFEKLKLMPREFLTWAEEHQMSSRDLMPINSLDDLNSLNILVKNFPKLKLNRNEGKKILDFLVDLILMGQKTEELTPSSGNWFQQLTNKRYPNTLNNDKLRENKKSWPAYVQTKSSRQGDRMIHKLHITYSNEKDLNSKLKRLSQMNNDA